jgi:hypothetical protein
MTDDANENATHVTSAAAFVLVPNSSFNFATQFLSNKILKMENGKAIPDRHTREQAVLLGQHMMFAANVMFTCTSLAIGTVYYVYNVTGSKQLLTLMDMLNQCQLVHAPVHLDTCMLHCDGERRTI